MPDHATGNYSEADAQRDALRYTTEVKKLTEEVAGYASRARDLQLQAKNLLDGMIRLNQEVLKLNVRMGDVESKMGLTTNSSQTELENIVRSLQISQRGIRESHQNLKIILPTVTPPNGISRKGFR